MKKIAELWKPIGNPSDQVAQCLVCAHYCKIKPNKRGFCQTRLNEEGSLYTLVYGSCSSVGSDDPIEKKPLYHFYPGTSAFSIATVGCNFRCKQCQNWEISQSFPVKGEERAEFSPKDQQAFRVRSFPLKYKSPQEIVQLAKKMGSTSIAYTYNEPTIWFEFVKDTALLAQKEGIKNVLVSNGYSSEEANQELVKFIDAANIDIKSIEDSFYQKIVGVPSVQPVLDTCKYFNDHGIHLEVTNLIIPGENDSPAQLTKLVHWIAENLGCDVPVHFSAYFPRYRLSNPATSAEILQLASDIAKKAGLHYVFLGNLYISHGSDTLCPECGATCITRRGYQIRITGLDSKNRCKTCGKLLPVIRNV